MSLSERKFRQEQDSQPIKCSDESTGRIRDRIGSGRRIEIMLGIGQAPIPKS